MKRGDRERLEDLADALAAIRAHLVARVKTADRLKRDAVLYNLVIVGEAVKGLSEDAKGRRPDLPWRQIAGLRDLLTHEYFRIDMSEIEKIAERDLAQLEDAVRMLRRDLPR